LEGDRPIEKLLPTQGNMKEGRKEGRKERKKTEIKKKEK
jgi:hypothetical protein